MQHDKVDEYLKIAKRPPTPKAKLLKAEQLAR